MFRLFYGSMYNLHAHTNTIEGTWTHAKHKAQRRGGRRTEESLKLDLTEFMWRKQKGVTCGDDRSRKMFSREIPLLLTTEDIFPTERPCLVLNL